MGSAPALLNLDRTFRIELQFLVENAAPLLAKTIDNKILDCFPTADRAITLKQTMDKLNALAHTQMCKMSSRASQSHVSAMTGLIGKMVGGAPPPDSVKTGGTVFAQAWTRLCIVWCMVCYDGV